MHSLPGVMGHCLAEWLWAGPFPSQAAGSCAWSSLLVPPLPCFPRYRSGADPSPLKQTRLWRPQWAHFSEGPCGWMLSRALDWPLEPPVWARPPRNCGLLVPVHRGDKEVKVTGMVGRHPPPPRLCWQLPLAGGQLCPGALLKEQGHKRASSASLHLVL